MDVKPEYETFGRDVSFEEITPIRSVYQPGILNKSNFFNVPELNIALNDLCFFSEDEILVYFRNISGGISAPNEFDKKRGWWEGIQEFSGYLKDFPAGIEMEYYYGPDWNARRSPEFDEKNKPYQAVMRLFDNAIQGVSCYVFGCEEGVSVRSERTNYGTLKSGEALIHDQKTLWMGKKKAFMDSARQLNDVFSGMRMKNHNAGITGHNGYRAEMRIIIPRRGALVGSLVGSDSATLFIEHSDLEQIVQKHEEKKERMHAMFSR